MTTQRTHTCNLCHGSVANEVSGVGVRWTTNRDIEFTTPGQAETHVCQTCLGAIEKALEDLRLHERMRDELSAAHD